MGHKTLVVPFLLIMLTAAGCGGSSSSSNNDGPGGGSGGEEGVTFTASGAVTGQFNGMMDFHYMDFDDFGVDGARWELSGNDGSGGSQSFSLVIAIESLDNGGAGIGRPPVGSYDIGFEINSTEVFTTIFTHIGAGGVVNSTEYVSDSDTWTGTLTITESSSNVVKGTFSANLFSEDFCTAEGCVGDSVNINGEFTAHERVF
ncbi:MAG: hypothetical protein LAT61_06650 [Alcanivorax sp.]|nr:hypothetical protein [Alcanivorax sp.]